MERNGPRIAVRVDPDLRAQMKAEADRRFGGNESFLVREATVLYLRLRRTLGAQYEPTLAGLLGDPEETEAAA